MDAASVLLVVAAVGVNFGWQPDQRDPQAYEVVVQLEPQLVDALADGHVVPIDAHIPPGVAPIRKVRILVGTGDVPRTPLAAGSPSRPQTTAYPPRNDAAAAESRSTSSQPIVVRGQNPSWSDDRYDNVDAGNSRRYEQLGPTIGVEPIRTAQAPPLLDRVQSAAVETGNTLRSGVEAGIQQANQQLSRAGGSSASPPPVWAPPPLWEGSTAHSPSAATSLAPSASTAPATSSTAWTSIRPDLAPPRLPVPALTSTELRVAGTGSSAVGSGPSFPSTFDNRTPLHSVLADPTTSGGQSASVRNPAAAPDWSNSWGSAPATSQTAASQPASSSTAAAEEARWAWPEPNSATAGTAPPSNPPSSAYASSGSTAATDDRYSQPAITPSSASDPRLDPARPSAAPTNSTSDNNAGLPPVNLSSPPSQPVAAQPSASPANPPAGAPDQQPAIRYAAPASSAAPAATPNNELPWWPMIGVSVGLAGSLAANLFLGMSYADARQKYRTLVRKTTHAFQKSAGVAA